MPAVQSDVLQTNYDAADRLLQTAPLDPRRVQAIIDAAKPMTYDNLKLRDPALVAAADRDFARAFPLQPGRRARQRHGAPVPTRAPCRRTRLRDREARKPARRIQPAVNLSNPRQTTDPSAAS